MYISSYAAMYVINGSLKDVVFVKPWNVIINVFNVIIINIDNFICVLLYVIERVYRLLSLNPECNHNHNHNVFPKIISSSSLLFWVMWVISCDVEYAISVEVPDIDLIIVVMCDTYWYIEM